MPLGDDPAIWLCSRRPSFVKTGDALPQQPWSDLDVAGLTSGYELMFDAAGTPYVAYSDAENSKKTSVMKFERGAWNPVGKRGFSVNEAEYIQLAFDAMNQPFIAFHRQTGDTKNRAIEIMRFENGEWVNVTSLAIPETSLSGISYFAVDSAGSLYVAYSEFIKDGKGAYRYSIMKYEKGEWISMKFPVLADSYSMVLDANEAPLVTYVEHVARFPDTIGRYSFMKYEKGAWTSAKAPSIDLKSWFYHLMIDATGSPVLLYQEPGRKVSMVRLQENGWSFSGTWEFTSSDTPVQTKINGKISLVYLVNARYRQVSALVLKGSEWIPWGVSNESIPPKGGVSGFSRENILSSNPSLALDASGVPYVAYIDGGNGNKMVVKKYENETWVSVGAPLFSFNSTLLVPSLAMGPSGVPYVAYLDDDDARHSSLWVKKLENNEWTSVGASLENSGGPPSLSFDFQGKPHMLYRQCAVNSQTGSRSAVMDLEDDVWIPRRKTDLLGELTRAALAMDSKGTPYMAYWEDYRALSVLKYEYGRWVSLGSPGMSSCSLCVISLALGPGDVPYVAFTDEDNKYRLSIKKFEHGKWIFVGHPGISSGKAVFPALAFNPAGAPIVFYVNAAADAQAGEPLFSIMKFQNGAWVSGGLLGNSFARN